MDDNEQFSGWNLKWSAENYLSDTSHTKFQIYFDSNRYSGASTATQNDFGQGVNTVDVDFQHSFELAADHQIVWGAGYRNTRLTTSNSNVLAMAIPVEQWDEYTAFVQDTITLSPDKLQLVTGVKVQKSGVAGVPNPEELQAQMRQRIACQ